MNLYGETTTTYGIPGTILAYSPERGIKCKSLIVWGDTSGEFLLLVNNAVKGGARSSEAARTIQVWWDAPIMINPGETVEITGTHYSPGVKSLKANLLAELV